MRGLFKAFCELAGVGVRRLGIKRGGEKGRRGGKSYCLAEGVSFFGTFISELMGFFVATNTRMTWSPSKLDFEWL